MWLSEQEKDGVYKAIYNRRDIRHFKSDPVDEETLIRILQAAHQAPSVGYMQPWNFIVIKSGDIKQKLKNVVDKEIGALGLHFEGQRADLYKSLKVEGLLEAPVTVCVTCDPTREGPHVVGRNSIPETDAYSVVCAIQNLWLAAYAEGISAGWVSFYKKADVREILAIPPHIEPIALISLGYPVDYPDRPLLEIVGWGDRYPFDDMIYAETWDQSYASTAL